MSINARKTRKTLKDDVEFMARYLSQTEGGELRDWIDKLTPRGTVFDDVIWTKQGYKLIESYDYTSKNGDLLYQVLRYHHKLIDGHKKFPLRHKDPDTGYWINGASIKVAYRWHHIAASDPDAVIYVCEGEKDCDNLAKLGYVTTTVAGQNWSTISAAVLRGRDVVILEDNDAEGRDNAENTADALKDEAKSIRTIRLPGLKHKGDVSDWLADGHTKEEFDAVIDKTPKPPPRFAFIDYSNWDHEYPPDQKFAVKDRFPSENVSLVSGAGSMGKSLLFLQQGVAHSLNGDYLGTTALTGPSIIIDCEDTAAVFHKRLADILRHNNALFSTVMGKLHLLSWAGQDAVLGAYNHKTSRVEPTQLYYELHERACDIKPVSICISSVANVFAGSEIDRTQVQQFVGLMQRVAMDSGAAVILSSHPSLMGISSGSGISGSTQWHNAVRARAVLKGVGANGETNGNDLAPKTDLRILEFYKNNYGPLTESIALKYVNGLFVPVTASSAETLERNIAAEQIFLTVMAHLIGQGQDLAPARNSPNCGFKMIAAHGLAVGFSKPEMEAAQQRLLDNREIHIANEGSPTRRKKVLKPGPGPAAPETTM